MAWSERYVRADAAGSGDGTTNTNSGANGAFQLGEAITHSQTNTGIRYNIVAAGGTFANTTTTRTFNGVGTTTAPNWWRGCSATAGDLDADFVTAKPSITFTTGTFSVTGAHQIFSNLNISGAAAASQVSLTGASIQFDRCRAQNTNANSAAAALATGTGGGVRITRCWFKATSTATRVVNVTIGTKVTGCTVEGGGIGIDISSTAIIQKCVLRDNGSHGINLNAANTMTVSECSIYSAGGDGIRITTIPGTLCEISECVINESAGYGINNNTGTNTNIIMRIGNTFWSNTSGNENGFGDSPSFSEANDSASSFVNAAGGDFTIVNTSAAYSTGLPGLFENESFTSYADRGAVRHADPAGGSIAFPVARAI